MGEGTMATLYELTDQYRALLDAACDHADDDGQLSPEFVAQLDSINDDIDHKLEGYCKVVSSLLTEQEAFEKEAARLLGHAKSIERNVAELKRRMKEWLEQAGTLKRKTGLFSLTVAKNSQPKVTVLALDLVPAKFDKPREREVSNSEIAKAWKAGEEIPGVDVVQGTHLRIS